MFGVFGLFSIWTPITWTFVFALYLFLLPRRWPFLVPYTAAFIGLNVLTGIVLANLGLFKYIKPSYQYLDLVDFTVWFILAAYIYVRAERIRIRQSPISQS